MLLLLPPPPLLLLLLLLLPDHGSRLPSLQPPPTALVCFMGRRTGERRTPELFAFAGVPKRPSADPPLPVSLAWLRRLCMLGEFSRPGRIEPLNAFAPPRPKRSARGAADPPRLLELKKSSLPLENVLGLASPGLLDEESRRCLGIFWPHRWSLSLHPGRADDGCATGDFDCDDGSTLGVCEILLRLQRSVGRLVFLAPCHESSIMIYNAGRRRILKVAANA